MPKPVILIIVIPIRRLAERNLPRMRENRTFVRDSSTPPCWAPLRMTRRESHPNIPMIANALQVKIRTGLLPITTSVIAIIESGTTIPHARPKKTALTKVSAVIISKLGIPINLTKKSLPKTPINTKNRTDRKAALFIYKK